MTPGQGAKIPHTLRPKHTKEAVLYTIINSIKTLKMVHIKTILKNPTEQTFGLYGKRRGWDDLREQHRNMYIIKCETDRQYRLDA